MKVSLQIKQLGLVIGSLMLLAGMKAWAEPNDRNIVRNLVQDFRKDVELFEKGLADQNMSLPSLVLKRSLLLLQSRGNPDAEFKSLKEFKDVESEVLKLINEEPSLKPIAEKLKKGEKLLVKDIAEVEKAIFGTKAGQALIENGTVGKLAEVVRLEVEKRIKPGETSEALLTKMANSKLATLPKGWEVGEESPLLKKINGKLKELLKDPKDPKAEVPTPTFADLQENLKKLGLSKDELLELNATLAPLPVLANGGFSAEETLRDLYDVFSSQQPSNQRPSFDRILDSLAEQLPQPNPQGVGGLRPLSQLPPLAPGGFRSSPGGIENGFFSNNFQGGSPRFQLNPDEEALTGKSLSDKEKACLRSAKPQNYELTLGMGGGSAAACSSTPVALDIERAKTNPTPNKDGMCEVNFFTAKHCVEGPRGLGAITGLNIQGVNEPIGRAEILVEDTTRSVTGGNDSAVIRVEMSCARAKTLSYQKPATSDQASMEMEPKSGTAMMIARNREVNVEQGGSPFLFARGYLAGGQPSFSGFAVTQDEENKGQVVKQGDSGGFQIGCVNDKPLLFGATSTVLVTEKGQRGGALGRAASLASLDWLNTVLRSGTGTPLEGLVANASRDRLQKRTGVETPVFSDKVTHPGSGI